MERVAPAQAAIPAPRPKLRTKKKISKQEEREAITAYEAKVARAAAIDVAANEANASATERKKAMLARTQAIEAIRSAKRSKRLAQNRASYALRVAAKRANAIHQPPAIPAVVRRRLRVKQPDPQGGSRPKTKKKTALLLPFHDITDDASFIKV